MSEEIGPAVGSPLPGFSLLDATGTSQTPADLAGENGLLLVFVIGTWCSGCIQTFYALGKYAHVYEENGVQVAIVARDEPAALENFRRTAPVPIDYTMLSDPEDTVYGAYNVGTTHMWLLIDRDGIVRTKYVDMEATSRSMSHLRIMAEIQDNLLPSAV